MVFADINFFLLIEPVMLGWACGSGGAVGFFSNNFLLLFYFFLFIDLPTGSFINTYRQIYNHNQVLHSQTLHTPESSQTKS